MAVRLTSPSLSPRSYHDPSEQYHLYEQLERTGDDAVLSATLLAESDGSYATLAPATSAEIDGLTEIPSLQLTGFAAHSLPASRARTPTGEDVRSGTNCLRRAPTSIIDGVLYLGSFRDVNNADACAAAGIGAYLCVARECSVPAHAAAAGAPSLHLPLSDSAEERLAAHIPAAVAFIDAQAAAGRRVALFCQQGRSRSVSLAVAYVMQSLGAELRDSAAALEYVSSRYPRADPNLWFIQQLRDAWTPAA
eukprot:CAMPEP_0174878092 /NCGR_PEP_ID=MMETSP1114-20130205/82585_1 /TAXON_ID=312471 /ORGANISM="Neobodo designis, Strain CCAP 1951/1" /LENGTH=249 /DNA_ID=CAMNT_0016113479 /DNA_START=134 /DNA_END=883 /DNA_ORIENTATION=+